MTPIKIATSQSHQQQKTSKVIMPPEINSLTDQAKFHEFLYDEQRVGGQHILQIKMAEALSRILEVSCLERRWLL